MQHKGAAGGEQAARWEQEGYSGKTGAATETTPAPSPRSEPPLFMRVEAQVRNVCTAKGNSLQGKLNYSDAPTMVAIAEKPRPKAKNALRQAFGSVPTVIRDASVLALKHPTLSILLASLAFFLMATNPVEVIWPTHTKPMLDEGYANTVIGVVTATYFFSIAFGASLSVHISRIFKRRHAMALAAIFAGLAGAQIALALQGSIIGFVAVFILY